MSHATLTYLVLGAAVIAFILDRLPVAVVALGVAVALWATGVLPYQEAISGFGDPAVVLIAALFVVSEGLDSTGVTAWIGQALIARAGTSRTRLLVLLMALAAAFTALINVNGAVSALLPVVVVIAMRLRRSPSQLLLPLAFGAHAGSLLALTGTPVNVIVSEAAADAGDGAFGFWSFALVGLPLVAATMAIVLLFGRRLLPERQPRTMTSDFGRHAATLVEHYALGKSPELLLTRDEGAAEVVIPPRSPLVGQAAFPGMTTDSGDLVILAVQRDEQAIEGETTLRAGDQVLLRGAWAKLDEHLGSPEVVVVDDPGAVRRQAVPLGRGADQQHGDRPDRHSRRRLRRDGAGRLVAAAADGDRRRRCRRVPDARRHADQPHGHGTRRLPVRRLLEARPAAAGAVRRGRDPARADYLAVLSRAPPYARSRNCIVCRISTRSPRYGRSWVMQPMLAETTTSAPVACRLAALRSPRRAATSGRSTL
jgi:hypothetical protein